jgi:hypothetical protein
VFSIVKTIANKDVRVMENLNGNVFYLCKVYGKLLLIENLDDIFKFDDINEKIESDTRNIKYMLRDQEIDAEYVKNNYYRIDGLYINKDKNKILKVNANVLLKALNAI